MSTLFTDNFPIISTAQGNQAAFDELEVLKTQYPNYDAYYVASGSVEDRRKPFEDLYQIYQPFADKHFLKEVKTNFHQRSWEMYMTCVLLKHGFKISSSDQGPDIKITNNDKTIWVECIAPSQGIGIDRVPELSLNGIVQSVPEEEMTLRLSSSLKEKFEKYQEYLRKGIAKEDDAFIIAINRGAFLHPDASMPLIFKCLFCLGDLTLPMKFGGGVAGNSFYSRQDELKKKSGSAIPMNFFEDVNHKGVSAVIYSTLSVLTMTQDNSRNLEENGILVHNPLASNPIPDKMFSFLKQWVATDSKITKINN